MILQNILQCLRFHSPTIEGNHTDMMNRPTNESSPTPDTPSDRLPVGRRLRQGIIGLLIIAVGIGGAAYFKTTAPHADKRPPKTVAPLVEVTTATPDSHQVVVSAMGTVIPARSLSLESRVTGEVIQMHPEFQTGGLLKAGEDVLQIDREDYELAVIRAKSAVVEAEYALKLEEGRQEIARREWAILNGDQPADALDKELALRRPHLRKAQADLASARANLKQARIDRERTRITMPFNAIVRSRSVELGSQVAAQEKLADVVGTDAYWIEVSIPVDRLAWIAIPRQAGETGASARVRNQNGHIESGRVIRLLSDLESEGRMARLLVEVQDPLALDPGETPHPPLILGEYVRVDIQGRVLDDVFRIPRAALRDDTRIWLANENGTLQIRSVAPLWRDAEYVLLRDGFSTGDRLITSDLTAAVDGMAIRLQSDAPQTSMAPEKTTPQKTAVK
jgi:RND family efflux transporter MFP subunit